MPLYRYLSRLLLLTLLLGLVWSCAKTPPVVQLPEGPYFVTQETTYLLDSPGSEGHVLSPLFRGDKVTRVEGGDAAWWQVKLQRTGQIGWVRKDLLTLTPIAASFYYVKEDTLPLLECPRSDCIPLQLLFRGDEVQKIEAGSQGWWRVLAIKGRSLGWVPASALTESGGAALKQPSKPYFYVATRELILRAQPSARAAAIRTMRFNEQVQKIGETKDWFRVRQPSSGAVGWVFSRDLLPMPARAPRGEPAPKDLRPFKQREEPLTEPDFM